MAEAPTKNPISGTTRRNRPTAALIILSMLIGCLALHFLVEDYVLLHGLEASGQPASEASRASLEEMSHQDDLVMLTSLPDWIPANNVPAMLAQVADLRTRPVAPLPHPPKPG